MDVRGLVDRGCPRDPPAMLGHEGAQRQGPRRVGGVGQELVHFIVNDAMPIKPFQKQFGGHPP